MFSITGITGNVGGSVAYHLLAAGRPIRAVMRDRRKGYARNQNMKSQQKEHLYVC
jgi:uncharacterized protein YbjT (DUF2867 family)